MEVINIDRSVGVGVSMWRMFGEAVYFYLRSLQAVLTNDALTHGVFFFYLFAEAE